MLKASYLGSHRLCCPLRAPRRLCYPCPSSNGLIAKESFHTSCRLRGEGITPTVDAVCFPPEKPTPERKNWMQVPFLPDNYAPNRPPIMLELIETDIRPQTPAPQISTVADLSTHFSVPSVVSDFHDRATVESDVIGSVENPLKRGLSVMPPAEPGLVKELWGSFLDDLLGGRSGHGK